MSILFATFNTSNTTVLPSSRRVVVFSVTSGRRMTSVSFIINPSTRLRARTLARALAQGGLQLFHRGPGQHHLAGVGDVARGDAVALHERHASDVAHRHRELFVELRVDQH